MSNKKTQLTIVTVFGITGSYISYAVGSGFSSGNEVLQFFGSWGLSGSILSIIGAAIITFITCLCLYRLGSAVSFETTSEAYIYVGGKGLGSFFQLFTFISIFGTFMIMTSGAGSLFNQYWGWPQWVGSLLVGLLSGIVVLGGLETVEKVLGSVGILLLIYVVTFGIISLFHPASDLNQAADVTQLVDDGVVYQANLFALPPLSWIPGLSELNGPLLEGMLYAALCMVNGLPFFMKLGRKTHTLAQSTCAAAATTIGFYACTVFVLILVMANFDSVINPVTNQMQPFPVLSALDVLWPSGSWTYVIIIFLGIFTTVTGFLWVLQEWLFPGQNRTKKTNSFVLFMVITGILLGSVLPFSVLINFIFPLSGLVGMVLVVCLVMKLIKTEKTIKAHNSDCTAND